MLLFYLFLQINVVVGSILKVLAKLLGNHDVHAVYLVDNDAVVFEFIAHFEQDIFSQFCFDITNLCNFVFPNKVTNSFIHFFWKKFIQSVWPEVIEEAPSIILECLLWVSNMKINSHVKRYMNVIFRNYIMDWAVVSDRVSRNAYFHLLIPWIAAPKSWFHQTRVFSPCCFQNEHPLRYVFHACRPRPWKTANTDRFIKDYQDRCLSVLSPFWYESGCFFRIIAVYLDQLSFLC